MNTIKPTLRGRQGGEGRHLTDEQERLVRQIICDKRPEQLKMEFPLWNRAAIMQLIERECGTPSSTLTPSGLRPSYTPPRRPLPLPICNDRVLPFFAEQGMSMVRILTDRGTEYCGKPESHDYQLYLALNDIEHTKTKVCHPQTNGICERFHKTILQEFYQVAFRRKIYRSIEELQADLDSWVADYNNDRTHQGKMCCGRTPMQTLIDGKEAWHDKITTLNS